MKAVQILGEPSSPKVALNGSLPTPVPKDAEILVRVWAAGITSDEITWPEVYNKSSRVPGNEISGIIAELGPQYAGNLRVGQEVYAMLLAEGGEGQAEYVICSSNELAPKPTTISHIEAAALPIPLLTAWETINEHAKVSKGDRVLITGASGAVGVIFIQIAVTMEIEVIALASAQHHSTLKQLGASQTFDYNDKGWETGIRNVDAVLDAAGGEVLPKAWNTVKNDGIIVTVAAPFPTWAFGEGVAAEAEAHPNVRYTAFIVSPNGDRLNEASKMIEGGAIKPLATKSYPYKEAITAWAHSQQRSRGFKVVIDFQNLED